MTTLRACAIPIIDPASLRGSSPLPRHDLHLHTDFTDGKPTIGQYLERAVELGLEHIGFPEHCNLKTTWLTTFVPALVEARATVASSLKVHWGIEAKGNAEGVLAAKQEMLDAAEYVFGAFHSSLTSTPFVELSHDEAIEMEHKVILAMLRARSCHAVAHPGGLSTKYHGDYPDALFDELAKVAALEGVALELNPGYGADLDKQIDACVKHGCRVVLGSNAHDIDDLGLVVRSLEAVRQREAR